MRGKRRVLATLVIGELMFAFGEGGSSSEAIRDQNSTRVFPAGSGGFSRPSRRDKSDQSDPRGVEVEPCVTSRAVTPKGTFRGGSLWSRRFSNVGHTHLRNAAKTRGFIRTFAGTPKGRTLEVVTQEGVAATWPKYWVTLSGHARTWEGGREHEYRSGSRAVAGS